MLTGASEFVRLNASTMTPILARLRAVVNVFSTRRSTVLIDGPTRDPTGSALTSGYPGKPEKKIRFHRTPVCHRATPLTRKPPHHGARQDPRSLASLNANVGSPARWSATLRLPPMPASGDRVAC